VRVAVIATTHVNPTGPLAVLVLATCLIPSSGLSAEPASPSPTGEHSSSLAQLVHHYLGAPTAEDADLMLETILHDPQATPETVPAALHASREYGMEPVGLQPAQLVRVHDRTYSFGLYVPDTYMPFKGYGLVVCLHGAGFTGDAYLERWQTRLGDDYILACPTLRQGDWWTREAEELVLTVIRVLQNQYHIDPDRIFLTGMSNGGIGAYLIGLHHAPVFAGVAPMAAGLDDVLMPLLENFRQTPLYIIHGTHDQVMPVRLSRDVHKELDRLGIAHVYREHDRVHPQAGGHFFPREELPGLVAWFGRTRRDPYSRHLTAVRDASHLTPFGWTRIDATDRIAAFSEQLIDRRDEDIKNRRYARLDAQVVAPNRIEVRTRRVRRYTLFLNDRLVAYDKPVTIVTNGQASYEGFVAPSVETLLREARHRQERHLVYPVKLTITVEREP
jgi:poly(3-hydroxybutyrate) depolymerase